MSWTPNKAIPPPPTPADPFPDTAGLVASIAPQGSREVQP